MTIFGKYINYLIILEELLMNLSNHPCNKCGKVSDGIHVIMYKFVDDPKSYTIFLCPNHVSSFRPRPDTHVVIHVRNSGSLEKPFWKVA